MTAPLILTVRATYADPADAMFERACDFGELRRAMRGLAAYDGLPTAGQMAQGETYVTDIRFWGLFPVRNHTIRVEQVDPHNRRLLTSEHHAGIRQWRHQVDVAPRAEGTVWVDTLIIDAGRPTPLVARFARHVYLRRHRASRAAHVSSRLAMEGVGTDRSRTS